MNIAILHNAVAPDATADERDVLTQVAAVSEALSDLGHRSYSIPCTLDLETLRRELVVRTPDIVFNLVESLAGSDRLMPLVPALLDVLEIPYTGTGTDAIFLSAQKILAKERMQSVGLPTPAWIGSGRAASDDLPTAGTYIIKAVGEHASFGLDDSAILTVTDLQMLQDRIQKRTAQLQRPCFAEQYIEGREFNLSLIEIADGPLVLPPAEIDFRDFPPNQYRIVGYDAKWAEESFAYVNTPRRLTFAAEDEPLLEHLKWLALRAWQAFHFRGYGRVDFRVDEAGMPWILELNANPCLSPDAGFLAAATAAGLTVSQVIQAIIEAAVRPVEISR